ncbi:choline-binding surface protein A [Streptococcus pneumoniae]|nr:choline-binding surface protein A [Streptococcus pneumoniae]
MFASKSERKVHYSIRKFSVGVASVAVASLVMGSVVHATEKEGSTQVPTSSNRAESQAEQGEQLIKLDLERDKAKKEVEKYKEKKVNEVYEKLERSKHSNIVKLVNELQEIKNEHLNKIFQSTLKDEIQELITKSKSELDEAVSKYKKDSSSSSSSDSSTKPEASDTVKPNKPTEKDSSSSSSSDSSTKPEASDTVKPNKPTEKDSSSSSSSDSSTKPEASDTVKPNKPTEKDSSSSSSSDSSTGDNKLSPTLPSQSKSDGKKRALLTDQVNQMSENHSNSDKKDKQLPSTGTMSTLLMEFLGLISLVGVCLLKGKKTEND